MDIVGGLCFLFFLFFAFSDGLNLVAGHEIRCITVM